MKVKAKLAGVEPDQYLEDYTLKKDMGAEEADFEDELAHLPVIKPHPRFCFWLSKHDVNGLLATMHKAGEGIPFPTDVQPSIVDDRHDTASAASAKEAASAATKLPPHQGPHGPSEWRRPSPRSQLGAALPRG